MKPLALILTDTHLKPDNIDFVENIFSQAIDKCKELNIDTILHGGDWFNSRTGQPLSVLKATGRIIFKLKYNKIKVAIITGNHDKTDQDSKDSFLDVFSSTTFMVVEDYSNVHFNNVYIHLLPYFKESGSYLDRLNKIEVSGDRVNILLTHVAINGVRNNDGSIINEAIPSNVFKKFDKVLVAHYHNQQQFDNIYYIGSAYQANYGENDQKGFTILYDDGSIEFIQSKFPLYKKYELNINDLNAKEISQLQKEEGNIRLVLTGEESKLKSFDTSVLIEAGIDYQLKQDNAQILDDNEIQENITHSKSSIIELFDEFCEVNNIKDKKYGIEKLKQI